MHLSTSLRTGVVAGLLAGIPQVLLTQLEVRLLGLPEQQADIGPRFAARLGQRAGLPPSSTKAWWLAGLFHFGYAGMWGAPYTFVDRTSGLPPSVGGALLAGLIYLLAFSPWGAASKAGSERPPERRRTRETILHWTAALSFSLSIAYLERWLARRSERADTLASLARRRVI